MLRDGPPIGVLGVVRATAGLFSDKQIALLQTFADQAVIAIENVRLFTEIKEALERQTATSEILRVISSSSTDLQPVMDAVAENAARLCGATDATIRRIEGDTLRLVARFGSIPFVAPEVIPVSVTIRPDSVIERRTIHIEDILPRLETEFPTISRELRTVLATPLLRERVPIGAIVIRRAEMQPFTEAQIALLQTFADQAVIAIENVRLFTELQEKNRAQVTEALERQTATSEILRVISQPQTDVQPVFDTIVKSAVRLCDGLFSNLASFDGELIHLVATYNYTPGALNLARRIFRATPAGHCPRAERSSSAPWSTCPMSNSIRSTGI
jgi:two-component system NtrC family sensor kinase